MSYASSYCQPLHNCPSYPCPICQQSNAAPTSWTFSTNTNPIAKRSAEERIADALEQIALRLADLAEGKSAT